MIYSAILYKPDKAQGLNSLRYCLPAALKDRIESTKNKDQKEERLLAYCLLFELYQRIYRQPLPEVAFTDLGKPYLVGSDLGISVSHTDSVAVVAINDGGGEKPTSSTKIGDIFDTPSCDYQKTPFFYGVGVDVELELSPAVSGKIRERFFIPSLGVKNETSDLCVIPFTVSGGVITNTATPKGEEFDGVFSQTFFSVVTPKESAQALETSPEGDTAGEIRIARSEELSSPLHIWTRTEAALKLTGKGFSDYKSLQNAKKLPKITTLSYTAPNGKTYSFSLAVN